MNIQPLGSLTPLDDRVLIEPITKEESTKSGIVLPDTLDKEKPEQGKVIAVGSGRIDNNGNRIPMTVRVGDVVLFTKYGPHEIKINSPTGEKEYLIAKEEDILAIIQ